MEKINAPLTNERAGVSQPIFAYVGCFTDRIPEAHGKGISVYHIDELTGAWNLVQVCDSAPNPGFLVLNQTQEFLYTAHSAGTEISAYSIEQHSGKLKLLSNQTTGGRGSVHLTIDPTNRYVVLANGPGVAVFPINGDGSLAPFSDCIVPSGELGPYGQKHKGPHPHDVVFDPTGRFIVVPDMGLDATHIYRLDVSHGKLIANDFPFVKSAVGAGPRHVVFHPTGRFAYIINELDSTITAYNWNSQRGELTLFQLLTTLPSISTAKNSGSEIALAPSGNFVYASNRGHDSIAIFSIDSANGMLSPIGWEPTQGKKPRFFTLDPSGNLLYAANLGSDSIVMFGINKETGKLTPTGQIVETASPTCIVFAYS